MFKILVVEDDARLNQAVCTYLNDSGFAATGCLSAAAAYEEMYNQLYDLIVSDIMMPEEDGFSFAENVRRVNRVIPILFMSARDDLPAKQKGFQLGIDDYMVRRMRGPLPLRSAVVRYWIPTGSGALCPAEGLRRLEMARSRASSRSLRLSCSARVFFCLLRRRQSTSSTTTTASTAAAMPTAGRMARTSMSLPPLFHGFSAFFQSKRHEGLQKARSFPLLPFC